MFVLWLFPPGSEAFSHLPSEAHSKRSSQRRKGDVPDQCFICRAWDVWDPHQLQGRTEQLDEAHPRGSGKVGKKGFGFHAGSPTQVGGWLDIHGSMFFVLHCTGSICEFGFSSELKVPKPHHHSCCASHIPPGFPLNQQTLSVPH